MPPCLSGRFGVVVPVDFLSTLENRWSYAFAFGAIAQHMVTLIIDDRNPLPFTLPPSLKVFVYMVSAVKVGVACMPLFTCLSTPHHLLGGVLGLLYSLYWFSLQVYELRWCSGSTVNKGGLRDYLLAHEWLLDVQHLLCFGFLVCRFGFLIVEDILIRLKKHNKQEEVKAQYKYVQRLLQRPADRSVEKSWFQKNMYEWDPYFKFPTRIISTVVLCFFCLYLMVLIEQVVSSFTISELYELENIFTDVLNLTDYSKHLNYFEYTWYVSSACALFSSVVHISSVLVYYRRHIKFMWAGEKINLLRNYKPSPTISLGGLLNYSGYQIAFTVWGYLLVHLAMFVGGLVFVYTVISPIRTYGFLPWLKDLFIFLANFFVLLAVMGLQRMFLYMFFLQDKNSPTDEDKPLALNNRKAFHNVNYFLFFFNTIFGFMSCVMRLMKSAAVGLMLLPRIERAIMPQGFEKYDRSYCTWLGMIITDHHHSNPVLVCFCHLLLEHTLFRVGVYGRSHQKSEFPATERARARWLLMYTLVRNPKLILLRKQAKQNRKDTEFAFAWAVSHTS
ncbi:hypothetical protein AMELA_G00242470 [Ameiurus melas]|uniref:STRA6-like n=1 Tax=Ameiurus melas TaxID=219545 RepID=A0A7J5ZYG6_AMEME|nr:hypothetical protein AMELA_G00242470 [Ameiurus melas]